MRVKWLLKKKKETVLTRTMKLEFKAPAAAGGAMIRLG